MRSSCGGKCCCLPRGSRQTFCEVEAEIELCIVCVIGLGHGPGNRLCTGPGTNVQAQEHRHGRTGAEGHKSTGARGHVGTGTGLHTRIEDWPSRFVLLWGQANAVRGCGSLRHVLDSSLGISQALKHRAENMCPSECVASHDNACTLRDVSLFCAGGWWMFTVKAVRKKNTCHEVPLLTALMLASSANERDSRGGNSSVQKA